MSDINIKISFIKHNIMDLEREDKIRILQLLYAIKKDWLSFSQNRTLFDLDEIKEENQDVINTLHSKINYLINKPISN